MAAGFFKRVNYLSNISILNNADHIFFKRQTAAVVLSVEIDAFFLHQFHYSFLNSSIYL